MRHLVVGCLTLVLTTTTATAATVTIYTSEADLLATGQVESTDDFGEFTDATTLGVGSFDRGGITYTSSNPNAPWRTAGTAYVDPGMLATNSTIDVWDRLSFTSGGHSTALGFTLRPMGAYPMLIDVATASGHIEVVPVLGSSYYGFTSNEGITSVTIRDDPNDGHTTNFWLDDVSRGTVVPEPSTLVLLAMSGLGLMYLRRRSR